MPKYVFYLEIQCWEFFVLYVHHFHIVNIKGKNSYDCLKYENGVHRVQRIPSTESQGRIHTSACSIALFPENCFKKITISMNDLRIDVYRASGPGGQSVNTTDSAVRILHIPTGIITQCQNEKSQLRNKIIAMKILKIKLQKFYDNKNNQHRVKERKSLIKSGDRSEKIRTYNFPQDRCTDHRLGITVYNLNKILSGNLSIFILKNKKIIF
jgi:peptide chain release factor 1